MRQWIEYAVENYRGKNSFGFQLAGDLKERQIIQAVERYARGVEPKEVVALMDTSVFRSGKTGFLLTERYLYSDKYKEDGPVSLMFLKEVSVRPENNSCCVLTFKDGSTRDIDISVFLDVVDVLKMIIKQRDEHEQEPDDGKALGSEEEDLTEKERGEEQKKPGTETAQDMKVSGYSMGTAENRTVFEDSAEEFLRTVRSEEPIGDTAAAESPAEGVAAVSERFVEEALAASRIPVKDSGAVMPERLAEDEPVVSVSSVEGSALAAPENFAEGAAALEPGEASDLPIEIIPVDESEGSEGSEETFEELLEKAEAGDSAAMYHVAELYFTGGQTASDRKEDTWQAPDADQTEAAQQAQNVERIAGTQPVRDVRQAMKWFRESARLEYVPAMLKMMLFYREGEQVKKNLTLSLSWAKKAAATGDQKGQYALVDSYLYGLDGKQDTRGGLALLSKMAEQGDESAKRAADDVLDKIREAKERFDAGIKNPSTASGYYEMGMYCLKGDGFYNYPKEAVRYLKKAAEKEHVHAEYQLALAYHTGEGVKKDEDECIRWLEKAAAKSHKEAGELLADLKEKRRIRQEKSEFKNHLRQAEKGDAYAQSRTAELYLQGIGVKQDIKKGIEWYEKASETDEGYAARQLAKLYSEGKLVPVDPEKAAYWRMVGGVLDEL